MTIDWLKDTITGVKFYPITHEDAVIDSNGNTLSTKISVMERTTNKVTSLSSGSTHTQYPSAKCVFDAINLVSGSVISSYTGLSNLPILNTNNTTSLTASSNETITGTIKLHKVSKTGSYDDLLNKPTIPTVGALTTTATTAQATASSESFSNAISLHKVAKTGTYSDLIGTPTIPTVGTLTTTATTTQSTASSESFSSAISLHKISKTGKYGDLLDKPTLGTASSKPEEYFAGSGHTHAVTITASTDNPQVQLQANETYKLTVGQSNCTFKTPPDTHYTATPVAGVQTATTNATSDVADPYVNIIENSAKSGGIRISGAGGTSVKAKNGVVTISSDVTPPSALSSSYVAATDSSSPTTGDSFETSISKLHGLANSLIAHSGDVDESLAVLSGISFDDVVEVLGSDWSAADELDHGVYKVLFRANSGGIKGGEQTRGVITIGTGVLVTGVDNNQLKQILVYKGGIQYRLYTGSSWQSWQDFYLTSDDISGKEDVSNKVTNLSSGSTDTQYPSAKCVFDAINLVSGSAITSYDSLSNRPRINTTNTTAQATSGDETLTGLVNLHKVAKTGTYSDLIGTPTIPSAPGTLNTNVSTAQATASSESLSGTIKLHKVAKTGTYTDLLDRPTLGTASEKDISYFALSAHTHGNITSGGTITADTTVASGMKLVTTNASGYVVRSSVTFGTDATKALTNSGTWASFQAPITSSNKLSSDLVDDTNHTNKFVTATQITSWENHVGDSSSRSPSSGFYKIGVSQYGHISGVTAVTKSDITALDIPGQDTTTESCSDNTDSKIFLIGTTAQTTAGGSLTTYSHDTAYVGADGCLYSNSAKVATLDSNGKVPSTQLPSYVDDVVEGYYNSGDGKFYSGKTGNTYSGVITGESGKIYIDLGDNNKSYRWGGSAYSEIVASPGTTDNVPEGSTNLYFTNQRAQSAVSGQLATKIDKVTSTDNAVVRFDGTGGAIQNSTVTIDDTGKINSFLDVSKGTSTVANIFITSKTATVDYCEIFVSNSAKSQDHRPLVLQNGFGNVGIGTMNPSTKLEVNGEVKAKKFITSGGTSSQFVKGDGSLDSNTYLTAQTQANWTQTGTTQPDYIKNKPTLGTAASKPEEYFAGSGHTHAVTITGTTDNPQVNLQANATYKLTVGQSNCTFKTPQDTHYTAIPVVGVQTATTNATSDVADPYVNIIENSAKSGGIQISGAGGTTVKAKNGVITISSNVTPPSALSSSYVAATDNSVPAVGDTFETSISKLHGLANYAGGVLTNLTSSLISYSGDVESSLTTLSGISFDGIAQTNDTDISTIDVNQDGIYKVELGNQKGILIQTYVGSQSKEILIYQGGICYRLFSRGAWGEWTEYYATPNDISGKEDTSNKITSISSGSTDTQYPSAKCLYDILSDMVAHENTQSTASTPDYDPQTQSVSILEQTLTPEQQAQARENIGVDELIGDIEDVLDEILGSGTTKSQKKLEVIEASGTTLNSEENSYYHFDDVVTTLAITLPSVGDTSHINQVIFNFTTGSNPLVSFEASPISGIRPNIYANEGFSIDANTTYEINAIYNGNTWVLAAIRIDVTDISS